MRKDTLIIVTAGALSCFLYGCYDHLEQKQKQWHERVDQGYSAMVSIARPGKPLLVEKQLLALISREPDLKINPLQFVDLVREDDPFRGRIVDDIWYGYCQARRDLGQSHFAEGPSRWQQCSKFKQCTLWVYDESYHFSRPLYQDNPLYCWFCAKPSFVTAVFFIEQGEVFGAVYVLHNRPLLRPPNE